MSVPIKVTSTPDASKWAQCAFAPDGRLYIIWQEQYKATGGSDIFIISYNGRTWSTPLNLKNYPYSPADRPYIHISAKGNIYVAWDEWGVVLREYNAQSQTWLSPVRLSTYEYGGFEPCIATDPDENVYVFWYNDQAGIVYSRSRIAGSWEPIKQMSTPGATAKQGAIAAGRDGRVWCMWREKQPDSLYKLLYSKRTKDTPWTSPLVITWAGYGYIHPHMTMGPDNIPYVITQDVNPALGTDAEIYIIKLDEIYNARELVIPRANQHYPRLVFDAYGNKHVATQIGPGDFGWGIWYTNNIGGSWKPPYIMPFSAGYTKLPGIAADGFGNVAVVWSCTWEADAEEVWFSSLYPVEVRTFYPPLDPLAIVDKKSSTTTTYNFSWRANPENDPRFIRGYYVYKREDSGPWTLLVSLPLETTSYTYTITTTRKLKFAITTATTGGESPQAEFEFLYPPQNLSTKISFNPLKGDEARYELSWSPHPENDPACITGYALYKKEGDGDYQRIQTFSASTFSTTQTVSMQGKKVRFALTAIHTTGKESAYAVF